jgi:hypothetical protein
MWQSSSLRGIDKIVLIYYSIFFLFSLLIEWGVESSWVHSSLRPQLAYCASPGVFDNGEIGRMIGRGNRSTRRKPAPVPLCPPQTPHAARMRTRSAAVGRQRLTTSATPLPYSIFIGVL